MRTRPPLPQDNVGAPCSCLDCQMSGVTHLSIVKVPADEFHDKPRWLHGEALKVWWATREAALQRIAELKATLAGPSPTPKADA